MLHHSESVPSFAIHNAYSTEEASFKVTLKTIGLHSVTRHANVTSIYTVYKGKVRDDGSLARNARIASHVNQDDIRGDLRFYFSICMAVTSRVLISTASLFG